PGHSVGRLDEPCEHEQQDEEPDQADGPAVASNPAGDILRRQAAGGLGGRGGGAHRALSGGAAVAPVSSGATSGVAWPRSWATPVATAAAATSSGIGASPRRLYAARSSADSSACARSTSATTRPPKITMARSQTSWTSFNSEVYRRTAAPASASSRSST